MGNKLHYIELFDQYCNALIDYEQLQKSLGTRPDLDAELEYYIQAVDCLLLGNLKLLLTEIHKELQDQETAHWSKDE